MAVMGTGYVLLPTLAAAATSATGDTLQVAVVALGRGMAHVKALLQLPGVTIKYLAEVDEIRLAKGLKTVSEAQKEPCKGVTDF